MKKYALIVAGGLGTRMGGEVAKQFLLLSGKPVLMRTLEAFHSFDPGIDIILVLHPDLHESWERLCDEHAFRLPLRLANGGPERFHSVKNGLDAIPEDALVAIHDAVRPLVSRDIISNSFELAAIHGSAVPVMPVNETLRKIEEGRSQVIDRSNLYSIQTPQTFQSGLIKKAYQQKFSPSFTDDATLLEAMGEKLHFFPGEARNIKITRPEDLELAEKLLHG